MFLDFWIMRDSCSANNAVAVALTPLARAWPSYPTPLDVLYLYPLYVHNLAFSARCALLSA